jgi:flagellin
MSLSVLNNIPSLVAQNNLAVTNSNLQNTLFQLSSGSRINSGADDPAGLSIVNGLQANISALTQSSQNATDGVGQLQVADGALSQVTTLLNRAVTLATEAANGGLTTDQFAAITNEYSSITAEINRIGQATNFNGTGVFGSTTSANPNQVVTTAPASLGINTVLTGGSTTSVALGDNTAYTYTAGASASTLLGTATGLTAATNIATGKTINVTNGGGTVAFTAGPLTYTGATPTAGGTATTLNDNLVVVNGAGTTTYNGGAVSTVSLWLSGFNTAGAANGVSASLNASGDLQITSTTAITSITPSAANTTDFGALTNNPMTYTGANATTANTAATVGATESLSVTNATGAFTYSDAGAPATIGAWITDFNNAATAGTAHVSVSLNSGGYLVVTSTNGGISALTQGAANITDFGTLTKASDTVGDLMNQINTSGNGMTASINGNGQFQVTSSNGAISVSNNNANATLGVVTATNTLQDLINGINASGLGVTATLLTGVTNPNQLSETTKALTGATALVDGTNLTITAGPNTFSFTASSTNKDPVLGTAGTDTVQGLIDSINASGDGLHAYLDSNAHLQIVDTNYNNDIAVTANGMSAVIGSPAVVGGAGTTQLAITDPQNRGNLTVTDNDTALGYVAEVGGNPLEGGNANSFVAPQQTGSGGAKVFISDGEVTNPLYNTITVAVGALSATQIGSNTTTLASQNLGTCSGAASALTVINNAISDVAAMRGTIGAGVNRLNSATNVMNTQIENLTSAQSSIQDANIGTVVANLSKYQVLEQTGISALAQANQNEQAVLKLLQ